MPTNVQTIYGNSVKASPYDAINEGAANRAQQRSLASEEMQARLQDAAANRALELQIRGGYSNRAADEASQAGLERAGRMDIARLADTGQTTRANIANEPEFRRLDDLRQQYNDTRADGANERRVNDLTTGFRGNMLARVFKDFEQPPTDAQATPVGQPPAGGFGLDDGIRKRIFESALGLGEDPSVARGQISRDGAAQMIKESLANERDPVKRAAHIAALRGLGEDYGPMAQAAAVISPKAVELTDKSALESDIAALAKRFGEKDANTFWSDPSDDDATQILQKRDEMVAYYQRTQGAEFDEAKRAANRIIENELKNNADRWDTEHIKELRKILGITAGY